MRTFGTLLITIGILFGLLGARSYWHDYMYKRSSISVKALEQTVEIEPIRDGLSNILYTIAYMRDGEVDTTHHKITEQYTIKNPLPPIEHLQAESLYIRYVPADKRSETAFPYRVMVNNDGSYRGFYKRGFFGHMVAFILMGFMVRMWARNKRQP